MVSQIVPSPSSGMWGNLISGSLDWINRFLNTLRSQKITTGVGTLCPFKCILKVPTVLWYFKLKNIIWRRIRISVGLGVG